MDKWMRLSVFLVWGSAGAAAFWVPNIVYRWILYRWIAPGAFGWKDILWLAGLSSVSVVSVMYYMWFAHRGIRLYPVLIVLAMTLAIWFSGRLAMLLCDVGVGVPHVLQLASALVATLVFPVGTFAMATYHGDLGPLLLMPLVLIAAVVPLIDRWNESAGRRVRHLAG